MDNVLKTIFGLLLRAVLLLMGLVFFASVLVAAMLLLMVWFLRALWARLTGQTVRPWTFQVMRQAQWEQFYRGAGPGRAQKSSTNDDADVIDVVPKEIKSDPVHDNKPER